MGRTKNKDAKVSRTISVRPSTEQAIKEVHDLTLTSYLELKVSKDKLVQKSIENQTNRISKQK